MPTGGTRSTYQVGGTLTELTLGVPLDRRFLEIHEHKPSVRISHRARSEVQAPMRTISPARSFSLLVMLNLAASGKPGGYSPCNLQRLSARAESSSSTMEASASANSLPFGMEPIHSLGIWSAVYVPLIAMTGIFGKRHRMAEMSSNPDILGMVRSDTTSWRRVSLSNCSASRPLSAVTPSILGIAATIEILLRRLSGLQPPRSQ